MSQFQRSERELFQPSPYTNGLQPLQPYSGAADVAYSTYKYFNPDEDKPPSLLSQYWWLGIVAIPFLYVGVNMVLDKAKQEKM